MKTPPFIPSSRAVSGENGVPFASFISRRCSFRIFVWYSDIRFDLLRFADLMNITEEVTIHRPNVSTLLSNAFIRGDLNAATRGPFI